MGEKKKFYEPFLSLENLKLYRIMNFMSIPLCKCLNMKSKKKLFRFVNVKIFRQFACMLFI